LAFLNFEQAQDMLPHLGSVRYGPILLKNPIAGFGRR